MAIDTRDKRASVLGWGLVALVALPLPAGTIEQADRQQVAAVYAGISAGILVNPDAIHLTAVSGAAATLTAVSGAAATLTGVTTL
jgi:hypothetical protein